MNEETLYTQLVRSVILASYILENVPEDDNEDNKHIRRVANLYIETLEELPTLEESYLQSN